MGTPCEAKALRSQHHQGGNQELKLDNADKRKNNEGDHNCPDDVDNIIHGNHLSFEQDYDTKVPNTDDTVISDSVPQFVLNDGAIAAIFRI